MIYIRITFAIYNHAHPDSLTTHASNKTIGVEGVLQFWRAVLPSSFSETKEKVTWPLILGRCLLSLACGLQSLI